VAVRDEIATTNREHWERMVREGCGFTQPWLNLDRDLVRRLAAGQLDLAPEPLIQMYPTGLLAGVEGKDVLCLASGGGQQSAVFGLLGARVTVVDLTEGQLEGDRAAAAHYGYPVTTLLGDMRDISFIPDESFDLVYQAESMAYVPDVLPVYREAARVLRRGGLYRTSFANPATEYVDWESWDGGAYRIRVSYAQREDRSGTAVQFRHYVADIFNGLGAAGLALEQVQDDPQYSAQSNIQAQPGTWAHSLAYLVGFAIVSRKE
jgi:SAM-dependent methyltransferase